MQIDGGFEQQPENLKVHKPAILFMTLIYVAYLTFIGSILIPVILDTSNVVCYE